MAATGKIRTKSLKSAKFQFQLVVGSCDLIVVKHDFHRKIFVVVSIHIAIQNLKYSDRYSTVEVFLYSQGA